MLRLSITLLLLLCAGARAEITWRDCGYAPFYFFGSNASQQCAQLKVPLAYHHDRHSAQRNNPRTVTLALSRLPATGEKQGSVILINGGPGQSSIYSFEEMPAFDALREHFDLIFYDPRGVGYSTPYIACRVAGGEISEDAQAFVKDCRTHTPAYFLPHIGSDEAANDVEQIRRALNEPRINLIGYSYGTKIAALYALRFPERVRAIVMDGVVDIFADPYRTQFEQEQGFQRAFDAYLARCAATPLCPLAGNAPKHAVLRPFLYQHAYLQQLEKERQKSWQQEWQSTLEKSGHLLAETLQGALTGDFSHIDTLQTEAELPETDTLLTLMQSYLLWEDLWPEIDYSLRRYMMGDPFPLHYLDTLDSGILEALIAINCSDMARPMSYGENRILSRHLQHIAPFDNLLYPLDDRQHIDPCGYWPYPGGDYRQHLPAQKPAALPPLLLMAQRRDPATPWQNAQRMADYFQSPLITLEGHGHTILFTGQNACMDELALDYLRNPTRPPATQSCAKEQEDSWGSSGHHPHPPAWY